VVTLINLAGIRRRRASSLAELAARKPYGWAQIATFVITGLLIVVLAVAIRDQLPQTRATGFAVMLLALLGVALILAAFRVDVPMLSGGNPATWNGSPRDRVPVDHCDRDARAPAPEEGLGGRASVWRFRPFAPICGKPCEQQNLAGVIAKTGYLIMIRRRSFAGGIQLVQVRQRDVSIH
jgi:hypothetical protein